MTYYSRNGIDFSFLDNDQFIIEECTNCGLIYQKNMLNDESLGKFYDEWLTLPEEKEIVQPIRHYKTMANEMGKICGRFQHRASYTFLDFGAGWGEWSFIAKAFGANVYALEVSEQKKDHLNLNGIKVIAWQDIPNHEFDFINAEQVFEHISQPQKTLQYLSRSLAKDGIVRIGVPNGSRVKRNLGNNPDWFAERLGPRSLMPIQPLEHVNCFQVENIDCMAKLSGLERMTLNPINNMRDLLDVTVKDMFLPIYRFAIRKHFPILCHYYQRPSKG